MEDGKFMGSFFFSFDHSGFFICVCIINQSINQSISIIVLYNNNYIQSIIHTYSY